MFSEAKARRVTQFIECLKHTKGEFHGQPFKLLPWQEKIVRDVFGTVRDDDPSTRQYTTAYIEIPKKNGKSELGAAIALNMLCNDDEWRAEVYSCASDRQQAAIVFDVAVDMVKQSPALSRRIKIIPSTKRMVYQPTGSIYQVLSSEVATKHGLNVSACIFDELHTQPTRALYDVMTQGSGDARKQPLWFLLTTAGTDRESICWEVHQKALDIIEGRKDDPRFYPVLFGLKDDADWTDERNWYKANPSLDKTISIDKVRDAFRKAQETPADENMFRQLRLNQWVKQSIRWMPMDKWDECGGAVNEYELEGRACYAGLDLSSTSDLTAMVLVFPPRDEEEQYIVLPHFWLPKDTLQLRVRRDHVMYDKWEKQGFLHTTEGNVVHYGFIEQYILKLGERFNIQEIAYDRWNATMMVQTLEDDGFTMVPFGQGFRDMSPPTKELMRIVLERKLNHGGHPVLRWNMDNAFVRTDPAGNLKIDKEKSTEKVDGAVALVMALDRAMKNQGGESVYDPLYHLLHDEPNSEMTSFVLREVMLAHLLLWGNSYCQIIRTGRNRITGLYPLLPDKMTVDRDKKGILTYTYMTSTGETVILAPEDVLHIPGLGFDGIMGYSPIALEKNAIGLGIASEEYGSKFFSNGARPSGILTHPNTVKNPKALRESWNSAYGGSSNANRVAILEEGMKFEPMAVPNNEAQFLETRKFQVDEICRIFRVPPHLVGDLEHATFSNIEHMSIDFAVHTIRPWLVRIEQAMNRALFSEQEKGRFYVQFNIDGLMRGDYKSRMEGYAIARQNGWMSANDIRALENQNPIPADQGGDAYLVNGNMISISTALKAQPGNAVKQDQLEGKERMQP